MSNDKLKHSFDRTPDVEQQKTATEKTSPAEYLALPTTLIEICRQIR